MSIGSVLGALASSCEAAGKLLFAKFPLAGALLMMCSGFFWTAEALTEKPPEGMGYWENIKSKLMRRYEEAPTPTMKWAVAAGVFSMGAATVTLTAFLLGSGAATWAIAAGTCLSLISGISWYQASSWKTTSGGCNKLAAGNLLTYAVLTLAAIIAPALALLGTLGTLTSYAATGFWFISYPAKGLVDQADKWTPPQVEYIETDEPGSPRNSALLRLSQTAVPPTIDNPASNPTDPDNTLAFE